MEANRIEYETSERKFNAFVSKQEQTLRVSIYLLLNLAEDVQVEMKMRKKTILPMLVTILDRKNVELLILVISFLKKLSVYAVNKDEMGNLGVVEKLGPLLTSENQDLINAVVRLLLNLSFDAELRQKMIKVSYIWFSARLFNLTHLLWNLGKFFRLPVDHY